MLIRMGVESVGLFRRSISSSALRGSMALLVFPFSVVWGFTCLDLGIALDFSPVCFWWDLAI
jgi:hypothetical protein